MEDTGTHFVCDAVVEQGMKEFKVTRADIIEKFGTSSNEELLNILHSNSFHKVIVTGTYVSINVISITIKIQHLIDNNTYKKAIVTYVAIPEHHMINVIIIGCIIHYYSYAHLISLFEHDSHQLSFFFQQETCSSL
jgi:hypothetical protein